MAWYGEWQDNWLGNWAGLTSEDEVISTQIKIKNITAHAPLTFMGVELIITNNITATKGVNFIDSPSIEVNKNLTITSDKENPSTISDVEFNVSGDATVSYATVSNCDASAGSTINTSYSYDGGGNINWDFANKITIVNAPDYKLKYNYHVGNKGIGFKEKSVPLTVELSGYDAETSLRFYGRISNAPEYTLLHEINHIGENGVFTHLWVCRQQDVNYQWYVQVENSTGTFTSTIQDFLISLIRESESKFINKCNNIDQTVYTKNLIINSNFSKNGNKGAYISANLLARLSQKK